MTFAALLMLILIPGAMSPVSPTISGQYIEARTCDVWTGPCFANGEINLLGKHGVIGWRVDKGSFDHVRLDGLGIVAIVSATDTIGIKQTGAGRAVLIVDSKANQSQREALVRLAKSQAGELLSKVISVESGAVEVDVSRCKEGGCGRLVAGKATVLTRCLDHKLDKGCSTEWAFYPPIAKGVKAQTAVATEHSYQGKQFNETWSEHDRRGAYVGTFEIR